MTALIITGLCSYPYRAVIVAVTFECLKQAASVQ